MTGRKGEARGTSMNDGTTILAVDDTPASLALLVKILTPAGYQVRPADSGELALAAVAAHAPDLILLDVRMQGMDGLEVCRRLKASEETCHIPIILISAFAEVSDWVEGLKQGAADYITKPFQPEELLRRVRTHLDLRQATVSLQRQAEALRQTNQRLLKEIESRQHIQDDLRLGLERAESSRREMLRSLEDRVRAESALRESEARFRDSFEQSTVGKAMTGIDGKLLKVNRAFADMLGLSIEEMKKISFAEITHPDDVAESRECIRSVSAGECAIYRMEKRYKHRDGHWVFADTSVTLLRHMPGTPHCLLASIVDITERKRSQALVLDQRATLNAILESADGPIFSIDREYRYTTFNRAHAAMMKAIYGADIQLGRSLADYQTVPEDWETARKNLDRSLRGEAVVESAFAGDEGRARRYFEVSHYPVRTDAGEIIGVSVFAREITARKQAEEAIARTQNLLNETQRITKVGGWEYDVITRQGTWTDEVYRIHGLTRDYDINTPAQGVEFYAPEYKQKIAAAFTRAIEKGDPYDLELQLVNAKQEKLWVRTTGQVEHKNGKIVRVFGNIMDITERKQSEAEREKLEDQLRGAQRMEAIGVLAGGIAHDFNNLLSVILCSTEFAMTRARDDDHLRDELLEVKKAGMRAADLTRQLLAFSRKQVLQPVVLNLNRVAAGIEKMLRRILGEDIDYVQALAPDLGRVFADLGQIEQVLMNLVVNARDAMPAGGKLTIETANVELDEDYAARHVAVKPGPYVHLAVTDTGCGMDEATKARIFEPFFTTKSVGKGTGLGLSTVYGIVKQSGGNIWVYSEPGHGTAFKIYLPRTRAAATTSSTLKAIVTDTGGTETILIVEDEEAIRGIASRILGAAGYTVLVAASASDALAVCHAHNAKIHLLLTDVVMPVMGGRALAEQVVVLRPGIKVLYMSGYTDEAIAHHGTLAPGTHFIAKPLSATVLTRKVREALDSDGSDPIVGQEQPMGADPESVNPLPHKAALQSLAPNILEDLRLAATAARYDKALVLIQAIRSANPELATALRRMVETYDYDGVLEYLRT